MPANTAPNGKKAGASKDGGKDKTGKPIPGETYYKEAVAVTKSPGPVRRNAPKSAGKSPGLQRKGTPAAKKGAKKKGETSNGDDKSENEETKEPEETSTDEKKEGDSALPKEGADESAKTKDGTQPKTPAQATEDKSGAGAIRGKPSLTIDANNPYAKKGDTSRPNSGDSHTLTPVETKPPETANIGPEPSTTGVVAEKKPDSETHGNNDKVDTSSNKKPSEFKQQKPRKPAASDPKGLAKKSPNLTRKAIAHERLKTNLSKSTTSLGGKPATTSPKKSKSNPTAASPVPATKSQDKAKDPPKPNSQPAPKTTQPSDGKEVKKENEEEGKKENQDPTKKSEAEATKKEDSKDKKNNPPIVVSASGKDNVEQKKKEEPEPGIIARAKSALGHGQTEGKPTPSPTPSPRPASQAGPKPKSGAASGRGGPGKNASGESSGNESDKSGQKNNSKAGNSRPTTSTTTGKNKAGSDKSDGDKKSGVKKSTGDDKTSADGSVTKASAAGTSPNPARKNSVGLTKSKSEGDKLSEKGTESSTSNKPDAKGTNLSKTKSGSSPDVKGGKDGKSKQDTTKNGPKPEQSPRDTATSSTGSFRNPNVASSSKILSLAQKGEWTVLDTTLRGMDKSSANAQELNASDKEVIDLSQLSPEEMAAEINASDEDTGINALMLAVRENRLVIVERLLDLGANINDRTRDGRTVLHQAAAHAKDDLVKLLLNRKADASIPGGPKEQLPLHVAAARPSGVLTTVQLLLRSSGKDCRTAQDKDGNIPVFLAAEGGNTAVCRELLQSNGEQQVKHTKRDTADTILHVACRKKDFEMAKLFVDHSAYVDAKNAEGQTPLHISSWEGDESMVKYLHQCKANPNLADQLDRSPLHIAAERGHTSVVEILVDKFKANVSARTKDGSTLMHIASMYGHPDTALAFLKKGVPLNMPNKAGALCLHAASQKGHVNVVKALLTKGAHVDAKTKDGYTALHLAVEHCKPLAVQTLLGFGAMVELKGGAAQETPLHIAARVKDGEKCAEMLLKSGADVNAAQENGETALHIAARHGGLKMVQALLFEGADPAWQSKNGESPLHIAVRYCHWDVTYELLNFVTKNKTRLDAVMLVNHQNQEGETAMHYAAEITKDQVHQEFEDTDLIKVLLEFEADINMQTKLTQETPLHYCARAGNAEVMLEIVKQIGPGKTQVAVNKQSKNGWSPLLVASEEGHLEIVKILIKHNARVDVFDEHGKAALHLASESGHEDVADVLLWHRAFVNAKSKLGVTPLHLASQNGYNKLVKVLVENHSATIDALTLAKKTPLHMAAQNGQMEVCSTLLKMKADASATDVHGQTPLHLAAENDHSDVVKLFLKHRPELVTMANTNGMTCAHIAASKGSVAVVKELMRFNKVVVTTARNRTNDSTTLHLAAAGGHAEVVKVLLEAGAPATDENADGMTAIHLAAKFGHINVLHALKDKVSWKVTSTKTGFTALHVAANYGQIEFCREILSKVPATVRSEAPHTGHEAPRDMGAEYGLTPLHLAAQSGHEGLVRLLLNSPGVQADAATNVHGSIPLHLAAQSGHTAVVSLLLSKSTNQLHVKDKRGRTGLHLAAANGHLDMVSLLLGQGADIDCYDKNGWTPLHFCAKAGHLPVVKLFVEGGANPKYETKEGKTPICFAAAANHADVLSYLMKKDHDTHTLMEDNKFVFDLMVAGKNNNHSSIQEFVLTSPAPVETAVKLSKHFRFLAIKEKERSKDLLNAAEFCESMGTELNAIASSINSAGSLLKSVDNRGMPFLDVLIECESKEVVSHPSVQKYLSEVWMGHLSHWSGWKMIMLFCALLFIPPVWLAFSLPFKHRFNKVPVIKFMSYLVSHIYLIGLFIVCVVTPFTPIWESSSLWPHWYEWVLLSWLSGLLVSQLTNPEDRAGLGWIKVIIIAISAIAVTIHLLAAAFSGDDRLVCLYIRNQFFAFALLLCFVQIMDFLSFHHLFGPWAIIIRDLMKDLVRFLVILVIFMMGFCLNLAAAYQPVQAPPNILEGNVVGDGEGGGGAGYQNPLVTFELLFFALFGLVEPENLPPAHRNPIWTINLVKAMFGIYLIVTLIVLINLLIAMMSDTYQRIQAQSDTEWKFGRAKLFRNMNKTSATPSPLNLLTKLFTYCKILYKHRGKVCSMNAQQFVDEEEELDSGSGSRTDLMQQGQAGWLRNVVRRNTQVSPDGPGGFLRAAAGHRGPVPIEDVLNWKQVVDKYLAMQGMGEEGEEVHFDDYGDNEDKSNDISGKENYGLV